jgi:hypothetical protein
LIEKISSEEIVVTYNFIPENLFEIAETVPAEFPINILSDFSPLSDPDPESVVENNSSSPNSYPEPIPEETLSTSELELKLDI